MKLHSVLWNIYIVCSRLIFLEQIGEGAFGIVKQATAYGIGRVPKASTVAVKMLRGNWFPVWQLRDLSPSHLSVQTLLRCPYIGRVPKASTVAVKMLRGNWFPVWQLRDLSPSHLSVQTLLRCPYGLRVQLHAPTAVKNTHNWNAGKTIPLFWTHTNNNDNNDGHFYGAWPIARSRAQHAVQKMCKHIQWTTTKKRKGFGPCDRQPCKNLEEYCTHR